MFSNLLPSFDCLVCFGDSLHGSVIEMTTQEFQTYIIDTEGHTFSSTSHAATHTTLPVGVAQEISSMESHLFG